MMALYTCSTVDRAVEVVTLWALLLDVRWTRSWRRWEDTKSLERLLCSVFAGVVNILAIVPEASWELGALNCDHAAPGRTTA